MTRVGFILKPDKSEAGTLLDDLAPWLHAAGHTPVVTTEDQVGPDGAEIVPESELGDSIDLAVVLGGDGTMLRASRLVADQGKPVLGINLGQLGFLTGFAPEESRQAVMAAIHGELDISERMRLAVTFRRPGSEPVHRTSLNDLVLHQGAMARLVELEAYIDNEFVCAYRADGLIIATPTGSTAYNLSTGGPILFPTMDAVVLTPIAPHTLSNRPIVIPASERIEVTLLDDQDVMLTMDGQVGVPLRERDTVEVQKAAARIRLLRFPQKDFFSVLRTKLKWGER